MATRYWRGTTSVNINTTANWSDTSGGATGFSVPTSADDVILDGGGNNPITINVPSSTWKSLTIQSGYTSTFTHTNALSVAGNWTFHSGYTIAGTAGITISGTSTITSNGKIWPNSLTFAGTATKTLVGNFITTGQLTNIGVSTLNKTTTETFSCVGYTSSTSASLVGTADLTFTGGTWTSTGTSLGIGNNITIAGNVSLVGNVYLNNGGSLTVASGLISVGSSILNITGSYTLNTVLVIWNTVAFTSGSTHAITFNSLFRAVTITVSGNQDLTWQGSYGFTCTTFTDSGAPAGSRVTTFQEAVEYTMSAINVYQGRAGAVLYTSSSATNKTKITLTNGGTCALNNNFRRVDASNGRPLRSFNGTITDCINIEERHDILTIAA